MTFTVRHTFRLWLLLTTNSVRTALRAVLGSLGQASVPFDEYKQKPPVPIADVRSTSSNPPGGVTAKARGGFVGANSNAIAKIFTKPEA